MEFNLSAAAQAKIEELKKRYPDPRSAVMMALYVIQDECGFISPPAVLWLSGVIGIAPVHIQELITFYTMYRSKPAGQYHFQVCRTLSCALMGAGDLTKHFCERFSVKPGQASADGKWSVEEVECLGSCGTGPVCQVNDRFFENMTPEKMDLLIAELEREKPSLKLSALAEDLPEEFLKYPKSEVI
jgi:NADH-quinone oxidoreductase subunit E